MTDSEFIDAGRVDADQIEPAQHRQDQHATSVSTADIDDKTARRLVGDLVEADIVTPVSGDSALVHEPSETAFDSITQLAVFHRGWTAGRDTDAAEE